MTCHFLLSSPHSPNPHSSTKFPAHIHPFEDSPHLHQHFTALLHRLLSQTGKRIVIIQYALMASVGQDFVSIPTTESYAFNTVSAFFSFFDLWEALGKPFQIEVEVVPNELPSLEDEQINENAISLEQSNTKFIWVLRYADKVDIFTAGDQLNFQKDSRRERKRCLGLVLLSRNGHIEEIVESSHIKEAMRRLMASEERDQMRKRADALRESFKKSLGKDGVSCMELESFTTHITR
ncbi:hypothetical protein EZV62_005321 [Acer yangbiense]|uniref:Glycosyltransferase N-terminal domain-containing protein n=1 Tax=Acer yangbiense TaxID=1000413 RepID=A0A5C7IPH9_9ROSI|nr:hypothetical protein EZV62_005321 [Acer yangbiense]